MFRQHVLPRLIFWLYRVWTATWRVQIVEPENLKVAKANGTPLVFAHWHGHELSIVPLVRQYKIATMTSTSRDGQLIDFVVRRFGGATSRGSSTRGGIGALKGIIRLMREGWRASMAVDGPKGPLHVVKPGVFEVAKMGRARIVPMGAACSHAIHFRKSWNQTFLPTPFARVVVVFGEPQFDLSSEISPKSEPLRIQLAEQITNACQSAASLLR
ncbi:MAG: lysophospholipid acyltransferase family protein [Bdellovibrionales bacterium]